MTTTAFRVGDVFEVRGLPGQEPGGVTVEVTGGSPSGNLSLLVRGSALAAESGAGVGYAQALVLVEHGVWVQV